MRREESDVRLRRLHSITQCGVVLFLVLGDRDQSALGLVYVLDSVIEHQTHGITCAVGAGSGITYYQHGTALFTSRFSTHVYYVQ
jgi:hypothetical protein